AETGLYYNRHRYYDAESGQYLSPDPIGLLGGIRPQAYIHNPLTWIDPLGLAESTCEQPNQPETVDLASPKRRQHILDGDATGGGHRPGTGIPGKSEFPQGWSDDKIMHEISDIATDPSLEPTIGRGGRLVTNGTRDGIDIRVIQEKNGDIVSGFPTNVPRNPR
ncbi:RHS repeat-associated core domain-containing protein, partial [Pectobacterium parmentieri]